MNQKTIIVLSREIGFPRKTECYGSLKKACVAHGWVYNTLIQKKLPLVFKDAWLIQRVPFN